MEGQVQQVELENLKEQGDLEDQGEMEEQEVDDEEPSLPGLVCVEYPGVAANADKVVETLGGLDTLAQVLGEPNRRLELRWRPGDVFCKPTCGERHAGSSFLLRVKRRRLKPGRGEGKPAEIHQTSVEGAVTDCYRFGSLCDFQYLCMEKKKDDEASYTSLYPQVYFGDSGLVTSTWLSESSAPLFLPPAAFSRMDSPQDYQYRREATSAATPSLPSTPHNIIGRTRHRRSHHAIFVTYDVEVVPDKPRDVALNQIKLKFIDQERLGVVRQRFRERPVWSKNALTALTGIPADRLKLILPALSYYFTTGPWRNQWIRLGYDPRSEAAAACHQTLDYRVRLQGGARNQVAAKRSYANYLLPYKAMNWSKPRTSLISKTSFGPVPGEGRKEEEGEEERERREEVFLFREGRVPPYRQMFYQYGDIQLEEVKEILESSRRRTDEKCDEKSGWFLTGTEDRLREALTASINRSLAKQRAAGGREGEEEAEVSTSLSSPVRSQEEEG